MTSSIMHSCDESDDSLRITSVEVEVAGNDILETDYIVVLPTFLRRAPPFGNLPTFVGRPCFGLQLLLDFRIPITKLKCVLHRKYFVNYPDLFAFLEHFPTNFSWISIRIEHDNAFEFIVYKSSL